MGVPLEEVELLGAGVETGSPVAGAYALNMIHRQGAWEVRKGFGQLAQYDTSMSTNPRVVMGGPDDVWGYSRHVGSYLLRTAFGHQQVVSILEAKNVASNVRDHSASYLGQDNWMTSIYCVSIHDLTTGERWEEPIYRHTSEGDRSVVPLDKRLGQYLTARDMDAEEWVATAGSQLWFAEWDGRLLFGSGAIGVMLYSPCTFNGNTRKATDLTRETNWATGHCESAAVVRVAPSQGVFYGSGTGYAYVDAGAFPAPSAAATYGDRMVYAAGKNLFFSDPFYPTSIMAINVFDVPSDSDITALAVVGDTLLIMTHTQTWFFRAPPGAVVTQGRGATLMSDSVGCLGQMSVVSIGGAAAWCDVGGVYMSGGGSIEKMSAPIDRFFTEFITDPVTRWYPLQGAVGQDTTAGLVPPRRAITMSLDPSLVSMSYSEDLGALFLSVPSENVCLCFADSQWSVWSFDSNAVDGAAPIGIRQNIKNPQVICREDNVLLVGGLDEQEFTDASRYEGNATAPYAVGDNATSRSYYILQYGRGGGIDRSVDNEDYRAVTGKYLITESTGGMLTTAVNYTDTPHDYYGGWVTIDPWIKVPSGYRFAGGGVANDRTFLLPISIVPPKQWGKMPPGAVVAGRSVGRFAVSFTFDNTKWEPVFRASYNIDYILPSERIASAAGYSSGTGVVRTVTMAGVADAAGPMAQVVWDGFPAAAGWYHHPYMNLNALRKTTVIYIPMRAKVASSTDELSGMALRPYSTTTPGFISHVNSSTGAVENVAPLSSAFWEQWSVGAPRKDDNVAQAVDWAYKSSEQGLDGANRISARGVAVNLLSHGEGSDSVSEWPFGLFNTLVAADQKMTMAQPVDYAGQYTWAVMAPTRRPVSIQTNIYPNQGALPATVQTPHDTLRHRLIASNNALHQVTFNHPTAGVAVWGTDNSITVTDGDVLIADEQVDTIVTSDGLKCSSFSYLMFGFIKNRAETIKLQMAKAMYRARGSGRRRRGR